jgi:ketosteroid isomerase-like protein
MKVITATAAAFLLMAGMAWAQQSDTSSATLPSAMASKAEMRTGPASVEQHLKNMEQEWVKASLSSDGKMLTPLLSEDFVGIDSDGSVRSKADAIARTSKAKFESSEIADMRVSEHGDSAIVTGTWMGKGMDADGKQIDAKERFADTWVKKDGKWTCVASASAPLK